MKRTIQKIVDFIQTAIEPEKIILFGSIISGNRNVYSDIDLLLVVRDSSMKNSQTEIIQNYIRELSLHADVLIFDEQEFEIMAQKTNSFISAVLKSKIMVFEKKPRNL